MMTFDKILPDNRLWAVRYDGETDNALQQVFNQWNDPEWLWMFFTENLSDLESYFKITEVDQAIYDTLEDSAELECLILDISPCANLDLLFRPLETSRTVEMLLGKEKQDCKTELNMHHGSDYMPLNSNQATTSLREEQSN